MCHITHLLFLIDWCIQRATALKDNCITGLLYMLHLYQVIIWCIFCYRDLKRFNDVTFISGSYMNSILIPPTSLRDIPATSLGPAKKQSGSFSQMMTDVVGKSNSQVNAAKNAEPRVLVGKITSDVPTISELLSQNPALRDSTWDIVYSEHNKNKDYTKIKPGTAVYLNPENGDLTWSGVEPAPYHSSLNNNSDLLHSLSDIDQTLIQPETASPKDLITLGAIDSKNPTVSHLLKNHPDMKAQMWQLLGNDINKGKPYHRIPTGTEIQLNSETMEIVWSDNAQVATVAGSAPPAVDHLQVAKLPTAEQPYQSANNLSEAVQGYKGISYDKINCYELLVKGLDNLNIAYSGKNGLYSKLTNMAVEKGLAPNAYLNGEGIVKAAGSTILSKNYSKMSDWKDQADKLIAEIEPLLDSGQILSFSTQNRGHTGVVGRKDDQWTFINSGKMDNSVDQQTIPRGVGEEVLSEEIGNWFRSAQKKGEGLSVTLGQLNQRKIQTAYNMSNSFSGRI